MKMRIGQGYDVHRLCGGRPLILGGVNVPYGKGLFGHSDADVLLHALTDAILGALALPDIGRTFPDTDDEWKNADSAIFVKEAIKRAKQAGFRIENVDMTLVMQKPKISPYIDEIRKSVASLLSVPLSDVNLKAKTAEGLGDIGRGSAVEAFAVCLLRGD